MTVPVIGLDIGGTKLAAALFGPDGEMVARQRSASPAADGPAAVVAASAALVNQLKAAAARGPAVRRPAALGVATAGVVDPSAGVIRSAGDTIMDWAGVRIGPLLEARTGLPTAVENDVNAMALAEASRGAARGAESALVVAVGTGVGGALVLGGALRRGPTGTAGEIGHLPVDVAADGPAAALCGCGRPGHLEALVAGPAIARRYAALTGCRTRPSLEDVSRACQDGDETALAVIERAGTVLGRALGGLANVIDPEVIVLAGGVLGVGRPFLDPMTAALRAETLPGPAGVAVHLSELGQDAGVIGAAIAALGQVPGAPPATRPRPGQGPKETRR